MQSARQLRFDPPSSRLSHGSTGLWQMTWFAIAVLVLLATLVRLINIGQLPLTDEIYTSLAARGWVEHGEPVIGDGTYERAWLYSVIVGLFFQVFGDNLFAARLPSLLTGVILVPVVFLWTRRVAGPLAAWAAALLLCFSPLAIHISQYARFYGLFGLLFWLGSIGLYTLVQERPSGGKALAIGLGSLLCFAISLHLQPLTLIGAVGLGLWLVQAAALPSLAARFQQPRQLWLAIGAAMVLVIVAAVIVLQTGFGQRLVDRYLWSPVWSIEHQNEFWFYHVFFVQHYQSLWPLLPLLAILAAAHRPKPALFCFFVFVVGFVFLSFAGMKDKRYVAFLLPFLFVLWGIAFAALLPLLRRALVRATPRALDNLIPGLATRATGAAAIGLGLLFLIGSNGAPAKTLASLAGVKMFAEGGGTGMTTGQFRADWEAVKAPLGPWLSNASVVLTSHDVKTLYELGRYDIVLNANRITEITGSLSGDEGEFDMDHRTGRPVISTPESLRLVMACYPDGLILAEAGHLRSDEAILDPVADLIEAGTMPIPLPPETRVVAFHWEHAVPDPAPAACATLPEIKGRPSPLAEQN
jgi:4-amino-4-deoxy-L-arabinose transferase-like glycosyltransferase